ncbi:MAG: hypothetical protein HWN65_01835 [Candidatus Helarchaeota archaeon]|nr:hypothetical protein [Candidatus Helarchaeota archaeon]
MEFTPKWKWFLKYLAIFFVIPIIGTLAHELGHYLVALIYNQPAGIAYAYTYCVDENGLRSDCMITGDKYFWFIMGGPISTWFVALIGLGFILWKYRSFHSESVKTISNGQTLCTIGAAFSLRFVFNAGGYLFFTTILGNTSEMDETKIANYLGFHPDFLVFGSAIVALVIILVTIYYLPRHQRYVILIAGIIGGTLGYLFWYYWAGPLLLP